MTNEQVALQEAVKYFTTYFSAKFQNEETRTVLDIASIFNEHLYKMKNDYENTLKSDNNEK